MTEKKKYKTPAAARAYRRRWRADHPEYHREYSRRYGQRDDVKARRRERARVKREEIESDPQGLTEARAKHRNWRRGKMEDPDYREQIRAKGAQYRKRNKEQINARRRKPEVVDANQLTLCITVEAPQVVVRDQVTESP